VRPLRAWFIRFAGLFRRDRGERELTAELESNLELHIQENLRRGISPPEARRQALIKLGGLEPAKEACREQRGAPLVESLAQDVRFGARMLRKNPAFTAAAVLTLALGIGANSAVFSVVNGVLLKPLPYPEPERLEMIFLHGGVLDRGPMGAADFLALHERQRAFDAVAAFSPSTLGFALSGFGSPQMIAGTAVTPGFFSVLGMQPVLGRAFLEEEGKFHGPQAVVVSDHFWKQFLGANSAAVGRKITLGEESYTVVGVMPPGFRFDPPGELWPVMQLRPPQQRPPYGLFAIGRLKHGVSEAQAAADATQIAAQVQKQYPQSEEITSIVEPMKGFLVGRERQGLFTLLGAVAFVLLIAVVNVASLQLSRAAARGREMAIRTALGAGRARLIQQLLTESVLLAAAGGAVGLAVAYGGVRAMLALTPGDLPRAHEVGIDVRVLAFTAAIALLAGILFGLAPSLHSFVSSVSDWLKQGSRTSTAGRGSRRPHKALVVAEISLALVVLVGAGLLIQTLFKTQSVSPGFNSSHIVTALLDLPKDRYFKPAAVTAFYDQLLERAANSPGIAGAAIALSLPPNQLELTNPFHIEGQPNLPGQSAPAVAEIPISDGYFRALGVPLFRGRYFNDGDRAESTHILIINQGMARRYFPGQDPVGKRLQTGEYDPKGDLYTIVGVVGNVKYEGLDAEDTPAMYVPYRDSGWCPWFVRSMYVVVRSASSTEAAASALHSSVASLDSQLPIILERTMDELLYTSVEGPRFRAILFGIFAALALILAATGIYGVIAYSVSQRTQEIGVRMALGASQSSVFGMMVKQGLRLALVGVAIGLCASFALTRLISKLLFGVGAHDPSALAGAAVLLTVVALAACYLPARRAVRINPTVALRGE